MPITCPVCGGNDVRPMGAEVAVCHTPREVGAIPPGTYGQAHPLSIVRPCGHTFRIGAAQTPIPCEMPQCGLDSIATCQGGCERRMCFRHIDLGDGSLCSECSARRAEVHAQRAARAAAEAAAARAREQRALDALLRTSVEPAEIAEAIMSRPEDVEPDLCRRMWRRLVRDLSLDAPGECVELAGRSTQLFYGVRSQRGGRGRWSEQRRFGVWCAAKTGVVIYPVHGGEARIDADIDLYLDEDGNVWRDSCAESVLWIAARNSAKRYFVVGTGQPLRLVPEGRKWRVCDSVSVQPHERRPLGPLGGHPAPGGLARAVAGVLRSLDGSS